MVKSLRYSRFGEIARSLPGAVRRVEDETAALAAGHMHAAMDGPKSGVKYSGLPNPSSAPGEAPAKQFGDLYDAIDSKRDGDSALAGLLDGDSRLQEIARTLEMGNRSGTLAPRPWFNNAVRAVLPAFRAGMKDALRGR